MFTTIGVLLTGIWLILESQTQVDSTLTLIFGIAVAVLAAVDLLEGRGVLTRRA